MEGQLNLDCERFQQITQMAKMGWWESDVKNQQYICSDFIVDLLGLESHRISFKEFHHRIREDHRMRLRNEFISHSNLETYEQMFPIQAKNGKYGYIPRLVSENLIRKDTETYSVICNMWTNLRKTDAETSTSFM